MASISNVNSNSAVINVGRTTPVSPGSQVAEKSIPVVMASDQTAIPVEEQNKVQSEVALSLLGIPRAEVALGIFADVNTYDVNPTEWSMKPAYHIIGDGVKHLPTEAGALVEASRNKTAVLTSKRFFRYQPGRVSAATFGIKSSVCETPFSRNPVIRKYGIYDKYDGYYWETRNNGQEDNFTVVRRTQSLQYSPVSPYGIAGTTKKRGEDNLGTADINAPFADADTIDNTQLDDYRVVGLGAAEESGASGELIADRKILTEKRFELIDEILGDLPNYSGSINVSKGTDATTTLSASMTGQSTFYGDLADAYNTSIGNPASASLTAAQMEAKCKRDLDYWIDMFLQDLEYGGNAHTKWNTTNFGLSDGTVGTWTVGQSVGVFPNITKFERVIHERLLKQFQDTVTGNYDDSSHAAVSILGTLSATAKARLRTLQAVVLAAFVEDVSNSNPTTFLPQTTSIDYGAKDATKTFYDVKRNFWAYYVTVKKKSVGISEMKANRTYSIKTARTSDHTVLNPATDDTMAGVNDVYVGKVFSTNATPTVTFSSGETTVQEIITYSTASFGTSSNDATSGLASLVDADATRGALLQQVIKDKCQRDVGYVIDGYKNDIDGGGDAETTYNMNMFLRGTGMSVYSQAEDLDADSATKPTLSEPVRHSHLKDILFEDLKAFGMSQTLRDKQAALAARVVANFSNEDTKTMTIGNNPFPGNLITLRDGLIHVHGGVYDPSLLKDAKKVLAQVTAGTKSSSEATKVGSIFKLTEGNVTFGQHVKISWSGASETQEIQSSSGATQVLISKGEVLRVKRVIGPKGNEFTLTKADGTTMPTTTTQPLLVTLDATNLTAMGNVYIDTVVPFIFPQDYDLSVINGTPSPAFRSEIQTTAATTTNYASDRSSAGQPSAGNPATQREFRQYAPGDQSASAPVGGVFPYMYAYGDDLLSTTLDESQEYIGFVNTALNPQLSNNVDVIRSQIDNVNFYPEYVNWIKNNVKPEYWGVYEYRVPRSRFSHDALDGKLSTAEALQNDSTRLGSRKRVYSDVATGPGGTARPGQIYTNTEGTQSNQNSLYKFDFTKVTMLKIEFSWYGAVGALFLAYVPVDNGEARWVRVHHLRASNQLKIASLGNATLPITYTTYGGGDVQSLGDGETYLSDYGNSNSHNIVKYGASYYIDGGDRGTVRLYSHNNQDTVSARGKRFAVGGLYEESANSVPGESATTPTYVVDETYIDEFVGTVTGVSAGGVVSGSGFTVTTGDVVKITDTGSDITSGNYVVAAGASASSFTLTSLSPGGAVSNFSAITFQSVKVIDPVFYMGARVKTNSLLDQNVQVVWADSANNRVHLSSPLNSTSGVFLLPDRSETVYGVETKKSIKSTREGNLVRNRVQVYPTKMSTANIGSNTVRLRFKKTPTFQTSVTPSGTLTLNGAYTIDNSNSPITVTESATPYIQNGEDIFGWFRGRIVSEAVTVFGRLYKEGDQYYFELLQSFEGQIELLNNGVFLPDLKFQADGKDIAYNVTATKSAEEKEGLSSVEIASNSVVPIAGTGVNVATTYLRAGTEQFDLSPYFDYNKEYLSFPLTDIADSLYFAVDSDTASTNTDEISLGVTWEEQ